MTRPHRDPETLITVTKWVAHRPEATVHDVAHEFGLTKERAGEILNTLVITGMLTPTTDGKRTTYLYVGFSKIKVLPILPEDLNMSTLLTDRLDR
jgi:hypothetical protein